MSGVENVIETANRCLAQRVTNIPGMPLWHMGSAKLGSQNSFNLLQNTVDYLTCKAKVKMAFTEDEKEFMKELFEALWWGGKALGMSEAAQLANHYVNGKGDKLVIDASVYKTSAIVIDAMGELKAYILELESKKQSFAYLKSSDSGFLLSKFSKKLRMYRDVNTQGHFLQDGALLAEQSNKRLKNADNRFFLGVSTSKSSGGFHSIWTVESIYDFEPFSKKSYVTNIPLGSNTLTLPDGLSQYLTEIGVAMDFTYTATWREWWK
ncbi:hypothetical protein AGMMS49545_23140 [Betaproteobacteria bacterium]|nr:hypothetical protein AGMMS49545_23140 [Betaproteobacteria bacterium]GHU48549.1 hypothetical protein AGMMS50289_25270 [Betaproteobacteria bacterium]